MAAGLDDRAWDSAVGEIADFIGRHGHSYPPAAEHMADGRSLFRWANNARYKYRRGMLLPRRIAQLEALDGWVWQVNRVSQPYAGTGSVRWVRRARTVVQWVGVHGRLPSRRLLVHGIAPRDATQDQAVEDSLAYFVTECRAAYRAGTLPERAAVLLEALPGWDWEPVKRVGRNADAAR